MIDPRWLRIQKDRLKELKRLIHEHSAGPSCEGPMAMLDVAHAAIDELRETATATESRRCFLRVMPGVTVPGSEPFDGCKLCDDKTCPYRAMQALLSRQEPPEVK